MEIISFKQALKDSNEFKKRHLLLGNGFSIACVSSIFTYSSLYNKADFTDMPEVVKVFEILKTQDFELVINALENGGDILPIYLPERKRTGSKIKGHAIKLKEKLIETIAANHPLYPSEIDESKYIACSKFLSKFLNENGNVYTLNYDLLLYWTLMFALEKKIINVEPIDGFGKDSEFEDGEYSVSDYVTWQGDTKAHGQNIHYLHGALHLFDRGADVEKFTWINTSERLVDQARKALKNGRFPLFVAEGESEKKMAKIIHSGYLYHSYKSFSSIMKTGTKNSQNCLFTYGVSFSENDEHILTKIAKGKVAHLYVSIYGDPSIDSNKKIIASAEKLKRKRKYNDLEISYYDAATAKVWG